VAVVVLFDTVLAGDDPRGTPGMVATFTAVLATDLLGAVLTMTAVRLQDGAVGRRAVIQALVTGATAAITTTSLALVAVVVHNRQVAWLLLVVTGILFLAYRGPTPPCVSSTSGWTAARVQQGRRRLGAVGRGGHRRHPRPGP
jgi:hypothetical protein